MGSLLNPHSFICIPTKTMYSLVASAEEGKKPSDETLLTLVRCCFESLILFARESSYQNIAYEGENTSHRNPQASIRRAICAEFLASRPEFPLPRETFSGWGREKGRYNASFVVGTNPDAES